MTGRHTDFDSTAPHRGHRLLRTMVLAMAACASAPLLAAQSGGPQTMPLHALDVHPLFDAVDLNHDGCATLAEWTQAGAPKGPYEKFKDAKGCVTYKRMDDEPPLVGMDANGDGTLTLEELKAFDAKMQRR